MNADDGWYYFSLFIYLFETELQNKNDDHRLIEKFNSYKKKS